MTTMRHRRLNQTYAIPTPAAPTDDLFGYAQRMPIAGALALAPTLDDELWSVKIVRMKTGLSRASVYKYMALGLFPRQRHIGPGRIAWRASDIRKWIESRPE